tara:strand:+ start:755 stop:1114 length:360 start_codon:yes stop_codon:yes gene_type:complete
MKLLEHEKNMEHPMYRKGFQYVFDHYGVPRLPSEELIDLRETHSNLIKDFNKLKQKSLKQDKELQKRIDDLEHKLKLSENTKKSLRRENTIKKKQIVLLESTLEYLQSKWYLKPFINIM